jgi:hypothetical protein
VRDRTSSAQRRRRGCRRALARYVTDRDHECVVIGCEVVVDIAAELRRWLKPPGHVDAAEFPRQLRWEAAPLHTLSEPQLLFDPFFVPPDSS